MLAVHRKFATQLGQATQTVTCMSPYAKNTVMLGTAMPAPADVGLKYMTESFKAYHTMMSCGGGTNYKNVKR